MVVDLTCFFYGNSVDTSALFPLENPNLYFYLTVAVVRKFCQHKDPAYWDLLLAKWNKILDYLVLSSLLPSLAPFLYLLSKYIGVHKRVIISVYFPTRDSLNLSKYFWNTTIAISLLTVVFLLFKILCVAFRDVGVFPFWFLYCLTVWVCFHDLEHKKSIRKQFPNGFGFGGYLVQNTFILYGYLNTYSISVTEFLTVKWTVVCFPFVCDSFCP